MALSFDTSAVMGTYTGTGTTNGTVTAGANARGAVVLVAQNTTNANQISGITYNGVAMNAIGSATVGDATEAGYVYTYWLDGITAGGNGTVAITTTAGAAKYPLVLTINAAAGKAVSLAGAATNYVASGPNPSGTVTGLTNGSAYFFTGVVWSGLTTMTTTPGAPFSATALRAVDLGALGYGMAQGTATVSGTSQRFQWTAATSDDYAIAGAAFQEADIPIANYQGTATAGTVSPTAAAAASVLKYPDATAITVGPAATAAATNSKPVTATTVTASPAVTADGWLTKATALSALTESFSAPLDSAVWDTSFIGTATVSGGRLEFLPTTTGLVSSVIFTQSAYNSDNSSAYVQVPTFTAGTVADAVLMQLLGQNGEFRAALEINATSATNADLQIRYQGADGSPDNYTTAYPVTSVAGKWFKLAITSSGPSAIASISSDGLTWAAVATATPIYPGGAEVMRLGFVQQSAIASMSMDSLNITPSAPTQDYALYFTPGAANILLMAGTVTNAPTAGLFDDLIYLENAGAAVVEHMGTATPVTVSPVPTAVAYVESFRSTTTVTVSPTPAAAGTNSKPVTATTVTSSPVPTAAATNSKPVTATTVTASPTATAAATTTKPVDATAVTASPAATAAATASKPASATTVTVTPTVAAAASRGALATATAVTVTPTVAAAATVEKPVSATTVTVSPVASAAAASTKPVDATAVTVSPTPAAAATTTKPVTATTVTTSPTVAAAMAREALATATAVTVGPVAAAAATTEKPVSTTTVTVTPVATAEATTAAVQSADATTVTVSPVATAAATATKPVSASVTVTPTSTAAATATKPVTATTVTVSPTTAAEASTSAAQDATATTVTVSPVATAEATVIKGVDAQPVTVSPVASATPDKQIVAVAEGVTVSPSAVASVAKLTFITADATVVTTVPFAEAYTVLRDITVTATLGDPYWQALLGASRWRGDLDETADRTATLGPPRTRATVGAARWRGNLE